ncbi:1-deoxy-D-xylulose-5-phosphate reductoisomerase [Akkermansia muciniphila]|uniref:1-deoxy-D-xylulose-5-phosphate reductoisomerase n=1 Tax=Akkermansia muciniphila TaxID=239935 RepID=UPI00201DC842|nr:1-deoxy-D-xylulose-5-phosphate reductoisomerase [Akkermansia muciniphila]MCL6681700.1 1-deoxy-D-xylulose-5-phosphate reductoisomerase [Akkermansia muciniphila]
MQKRRVVILGSTGSIGTSALKVARDIPDRMEIVGLAAGTSVEALARQAREFNVRNVCIYDPSGAAGLAASLPDAQVETGEEGLCRLAQLPEADMVLISIVGTAGLNPALAAIEAGKDLAIASKEILVMAGQIVMEKARRAGVQVLPVDSEHNAIFQCLNGSHGGPEAVSRLILTASGGPFRTWNREDLEHVTLEQALKHPTWNMGRKITIDSATLFNKGLEMIEARWLFGVPMEKVDVIVHPQSIVHSMVEYRDGTVLAQMSSSDMCFPIQYAVTWPDRVPNSLKQLNFSEIGRLVFEAPRTDVFPALNLARRAGAGNSTLAAVYNAANEAAVNAFIHGQISFPGIWKLVEAVMDDHTPTDPRGELAPILEADQWARRRAAELLPSFSRPC